MCDVWVINVVCQINRIHALFLEHVDVLGLCHFIGDIEYLVLVFLLALFEVLRKCNILAVDILEEHVVCHLVTELLILQAAKLDEWA